MALCCMPWGTGAKSERERERNKKSDVKMNSAPMNMHFLTADVPSMGDHVT